MTSSNAPSAEASTVVTVLSDLASDGRTYITAVQLDADTVRRLDRDQAYAWARTALAAATRAEHDSLFMAQMTQDLGAPLETAGFHLAALRKERPPLDDAATAPLRLGPGVNRDGVPFIAVFIKGTQVGQWTCADVRSHATAVLEVAEAVDLDAAYYRYLTGFVGLDSATARHTVAHLADHLPDGRQP